MSQQPSPVSPTTDREAPVTAQRDRAALLVSLSQVADVSCAVADALDQLGVGAAIGTPVGWPASWWRKSSAVPCWRNAISSY